MSPAGERERIDLVAPLGRHLLAVTGGGHPIAGQVGLGDDHQSGDPGRVVTRQHDAFVQRPTQDLDESAGRLGARRELAGRDVGLLESLEHAVGRARTGDDHHRASPGGHVRPQVHEQHRQQLFGPAHLGRRLHRKDELVLAARRQRTDRPTRTALRLGVLPHLTQRPVRGRSQVDAAAEHRRVDGRGPADRCRRPRRLEKLLPGAHEIGGAGPDLLRITQQHMGLARQHLGEQLQLAGLQ